MGPKTYTKGKEPSQALKYSCIKVYNFKNKNVVRWMWALPTIRWKTADKENVNELDFSRKSQKWQVHAGPEYSVAVWYKHAPDIDYDIWKPKFETPTFATKEREVLNATYVKQPPVTVFRISEHFKLYHTFCSALLIACPWVIKISRDMVTNKRPTLRGCLSGTFSFTPHTHTNKNKTKKK